MILPLELSDVVEEVAYERSMSRISSLVVGWAAARRCFRISMHLSSGQSCRMERMKNTDASLTGCSLKRSIAALSRELQILI